MPQLTSGAAGRTSLPPILLCGQFVKVATAEGLARWRELRADGLTEADADAHVYHPDNRKLLWEPMPPLGRKPQLVGRMRRLNRAATRTYGGVR